MGWAISQLMKEILGSGLWNFVRPSFSVPLLNGSGVNTLCIVRVEYPCILCPQFCAWNSTFRQSSVLLRLVSICLSGESIMSYVSCANGFHTLCIY